jgi:streptogramin lyase
MKHSRVQSRLAALVTAAILCVCLLSLSSGTAWAKAGKIREFATPTPYSDPFAITTGPDGNLWFTELIGDKIGRITTSGVITEYIIPTSGVSGSEPHGITAGPRNTNKVWFTETATSMIGEITTK